MKDFIALHRTPKALSPLSVDPVTLLAGAAGLAGGGIASLFSGGGNSAPAATAPTPPPTPAAVAPPVESPTGSRKSGGAPNPTPSFVGSAAAGPSQVGYGQKSLLGQ